MRRRYSVCTRRVSSGIQSSLVTLESSQSYSLACHENMQLSQLPGVHRRIVGRIMRLQDVLTLAHRTGLSILFSAIWSHIVVMLKYNYRT